MSRVREYWQEVRRLEAELGDPVALVAQTAGAGGGVMLTNRASAARLLAGGQARPATAEELRDHLAGDRRRAQVDAALAVRHIEGIAILPKPSK